MWKAVLIFFTCKPSLENRDDIIYLSNITCLVETWRTKQTRNELLSGLFIKIKSSTSGTENKDSKTPAQTSHIGKNADVTTALKFDTTTRISQNSSVLHKRHTAKKVTSSCYVRKKLQASTDNFKTLDIK